MNDSHTKGADFLRELVMKAVRSKVKAGLPVIEAVGVKRGCTCKPLEMRVRENGKVRVIRIPDPREGFMRAWRELESASLTSHTAG